MDWKMTTEKNGQARHASGTRTERKSRAQVDVKREKAVGIPI
jgi:hypothetical protein